jgi:hypothetical protein
MKRASQSRFASQSINAERKQRTTLLERELSAERNPINLIENPEALEVPQEMESTLRNSSKMKQAAKGKDKPQPFDSRSPAYQAQR